MPCSEVGGLPGIPQRGQAALLAPTPSLRHHERVPGGTAMLCQETPLRTQTKTIWRDGRWGGCGCIVLECIVLMHRPSLPLPCPVLILASPRSLSAGKAPLTLRTRPFASQQAEVQLEIFTIPEITGREEFGGPSWGRRLRFCNPLLPVLKESCSLPAAGGGPGGVSKRRPPSLPARVMPMTGHSRNHELWLLRVSHDHGEGAGQLFSTGWG